MEIRTEFLTIEANFKAFCPYGAYENEAWNYWTFANSTVICIHNLVN
jgi:hypothetical protein